MIIGNRKRILLLALAACSGTAQLKASEGWYDTYEDAVEAARQNGVPLLIHFHASYCGPCRQMNSQVFSQADVQRQLRNGVAAVEVDVSQRPDLAAQFGASTIPRDVVVYDGQDPETLGMGFKSKLAYLSLLRNVSAKGQRLKSAIAATKPTVESTEPGVTTELEEIVGLEGFCPVELIRDRKWTSGKKEISETYRGVTYYFSSQAMLKEFRRNPRKYTPQNLGCDSVVLYAEQRAVTGKIKYGAFFDNELFLFETQTNRREFKDNPLKYARIRHAIKVDQIRGQQFH